MTLRGFMAQVKCHLLHKKLLIHIPSCCADSRRQKHDCLLTDEGVLKVFGVERCNVMGWVRSDPYCSLCEISLR